MADSYIPARDGDFDAWFLNFSTKLTASPTTYGLIAADATAVAAAYTAWHAAYVAAITPASRTSVTVAAKDVQRTTQEGLVRTYAVQISLNSGVLAGSKVAIGVNPRTSTPTPVPTPTSAPVLSLESSNFLTTDLRYRDAAAPATSRSKPANVTQLQLFGATSAVVITDPTVLPLLQVYTKVPVRLGWDAADRGKTAYIAGRWQTRTGLVGPYSDIIAITII